jgi:hypothetical protein
MGGGGEIGFAGGRAGAGSTKLLNSPLLSAVHSGSRAGDAVSDPCERPCSNGLIEPVWSRPALASDARQ